MTTVFFLNGNKIGEASSVQAFQPALKQMIVDGQIGHGDLKNITAEDWTPMSLAPTPELLAEEAERAKRLTPKTLIASDGTILPIAANAAPYASDNGRTNAVRWRETYRTFDGRSMTVVRDRGLNDAIVEWYTT